MRLHRPGETGDALYRGVRRADTNAVALLETPDELLADPISDRQFARFRARESVPASATIHVDVALSIKDARYERSTNRHHLRSTAAALGCPGVGVLGGRNAGDRSAPEGAFAEAFKRLGPASMPTGHVGTCRRTR